MRKINISRTFFKRAGSLVLAAALAVTSVTVPQSANNAQAASTKNAAKKSGAVADDNDYDTDNDYHYVFVKEGLYIKYLSQYDVTVGKPENISFEFVDRNYDESYENKLQTPADTKITWSIYNPNPASAPTPIPTQTPTDSALSFDDYDYFNDYTSPSDTGRYETVSNANGTSFTYTPAANDFSKSSYSYNNSNYNEEGEGSIRAEISVTGIAEPVEITFTTTNIAPFNNDIVTNSESVTPNGSVTLRAPAQAEAGFALSYQWYTDGNPIQNANSSSLTVNGTDITAANPNASGKSYSCTVTASYNGSQTPNVFTTNYSYYVNLDNGLKIYKTSKTVNAAVGGTATLSVGRIDYDSTKTLELKWERNGAAITTGGKYVIDDQNRTLTITNIEKSDLGRYSVTISEKDSNNNTIDTDTVTFDVVNKTGFYAYTDDNSPYITLGGTANLTVTASDNDINTYPISYQWYSYTATDSAVSEDYYSKGTAIAGATGNTYTVTSDKDKTNFNNLLKTVFTCEITEKVGNDTNVIDISFKLQEDTGFKINTPLNNYVKADVGDDVTLTADVTASQDYALYCRWEKLNVVTDKWEVISGQEGLTYQFKVNTKYDLTKYRLVLNNANGNREKKSDNTRNEIIFRVNNGKIYAERLTPYITYLKIGGSTVFQVRGVSEDKTDEFSYQWYGPAGKLDGETNPSLTLSNVSSEQFGEYYCTVKDVTYEYPCGSVYFTLGRYTGVTATEDNSLIIKKKLGTSITLSPVISNPDNLAVTYEWTFSPNASSSDNTSFDSYDNTNIVGTGTSYTINSLSKAQTGTYKLSVYFEDALTTSISYTVNELSDKKITVNRTTPENVKKNLGDSVTFSANAYTNSDKPLVYRWFRYYNKSEEKYYDEYKDNTIKEYVYGATTNTMTIAKLSKNDFGTYFLEVSCPDDEDIQTSELMSFKVTRKSSLAIDDPAKENGSTISIQGTYGKPVSLGALTTAVDTSYPTTYKWYFRKSLSYDSTKNDISDDPNYLIYGADGNNYKIEKLNENSIGFYSVHIENTISDYYISYYVYVNGGLTIKTEKSVYRVDAGKKASLKTTVTAKKKFKKNITLQWAKYNKDSEEFEDIAGATSNKYEIAAVAAGDYGTYRLTAATNVEKKSVKIQIKKPKTFGIKKLNISTKATLPGKKITLSVNATLPKIDGVSYKYSWYYTDPVTGNSRKVQAYQYKKVKKKVTKKVKTKKGKVKKKKVTKKVKKLVKFDGNAKKIYTYTPEFNQKYDDSESKSSYIYDDSSTRSTSDDYTNITYTVKVEGISADGNHVMFDSDETDDLGNSETMESVDEETSAIILVNPSYKNVAPESAHNYEPKDENAYERITVQSYKAKAVKAKKNKKKSTKKNKKISKKKKLADKTLAYSKKKNSKKNKKTSKKTVKKLSLKFNNKTALLKNDDCIYIINKQGKSQKFVGTELKNKKLTLKGDRFTIVLVSTANHDNSTAYGYRFSKLTGTKIKAEKNITVKKKKITVKKGKSAKVKYTLAKSWKKAKVTFASKNKKIASVNKKGKIKGLKKGKTKITVTAKLNGDKVKKTVTVTVK